jgi:hypothetical protein
MIVLQAATPAPPADSPAWLVPAILFGLTTLSALLFAFGRKLDRLDEKITSVATGSIERDMALSGRVDVLSVSTARFDRVADDRLLKSFGREETYRGTPTLQEQRHINWVANLGVDSPLVTADHVEKVIEILDRELDAGNIKPEKEDTARQEISRLNRVLMQKQAAERGQLNGVSPASLHTPEHEPWWKLW